MKVSFYAREDLLVRGTRAPAIGQPAHYYGRTFDRESRGFPALKDAVSYDADSTDGQKCMRACRKGSLWAADKATAELCCVPFVEVTFSGFAWVAKPAATEKPMTGSKRDG